MADGTTKEQVEEAFKAAWTAAGVKVLSFGFTGFSVTVHREHAFVTRELVRTSAAVFIYSCDRIMPQQVLSVLKAVGTTEHGLCIMHEPEVEWFKHQLSKIKSWVWYQIYQKHKSQWLTGTWESEQMTPIDEDWEKLEEWMEFTYPSGGPVAYAEAEADVFPDGFPV